jgi:hypothetical protein
VVCTSSHHSGEKSSTLRYAAGMKSGAFGFSDDDAVAMVEAALVLVGVENSGWLSLGGGGVYTHHCYARKEGWWGGKQMATGLGLAFTAADFLWAPPRRCWAEEEASSSAGRNV